MSPVALPLLGQGNQIIKIDTERQQRGMWFSMDTIFRSSRSVICAISLGEIWFQLSHIALKKKKGSYSKQHRKKRKLNYKKYIKVRVGI